MRFGGTGAADRGTPLPGSPRRALRVASRQDREKHRDVAIVVGVTMDRDEVCDAVFVGECRVVAFELHLFSNSSPCP